MYGHCLCDETFYGRFCEDTVNNFGDKYKLRDVIFKLYTKMIEEN